jgi:hypothetical protein
VKIRPEELFGEIDVGDLAYLALSAQSEEDAPVTGPVPSTDVLIPSSEPSTPAGGTAPDSSGSRAAD